MGKIIKICYLSTSINLNSFALLLNSTFIGPVDVCLYLISIVSENAFCRDASATTYLAGTPSFLCKSVFEGQGNTADSEQSPGLHYL